MGQGNFQFPTDSGVDFGDCVSAFQKFIRRGMEHEALWCATELWISNYEKYAWERLRIMSTEDVGLADPNIVVQVQALYELYTDLKKKNKASQPERLPFVHAVMAVARAQKSRLVDNKLCYYWDLRDQVPKPEFPDFVYDVHTKKGRSMGRGNQHFFVEAGKINNPNLNRVPDEFKFRDFVQKLYAKKDGEEFQPAGDSDESAMAFEAQNQ